MRDAFPMNDKDHVCWRRSEESTAPLCSTTDPGSTKKGSSKFGPKGDLAGTQWQRKRKRIPEKANGVRVGSREVCKVSCRHSENACLAGAWMTLQHKEEDRDLATNPSATGPR